MKLPLLLYKWENILSNAQISFQPEFSIETAILFILHRWYSYLDSFNMFVLFSSISLKPLNPFPMNLILCNFSPHLISLL